MDSDFGVQPAALALDVRDLLPRDHVSYMFIETVNRLDVYAFVAAYP